MQEGRLELEEDDTCWHCGGCRARSVAGVGSTKGAVFKKQHEQRCGAEVTSIVRHAVQAIPVCGPPRKIGELIAEVQAAQVDETLITPGLHFVKEVLETVKGMDTSQMIGNALTCNEVERMYKRRCEAEDRAKHASQLTELEAALAVVTGKKDISRTARRAIFQVLSDRNLIRPALMSRADVTQEELEMTPAFTIADMTHGAEDRMRFGQLTLAYRELMPCLWKLLSNPALNLREDLCTDVQNIFDESSDPTSRDPFRGGSFGPFVSAMYFRALKAVIPGLVVPVVVMIVLDGTNVVGTGSRIVNPLYACILNIAPHHLFKEYSMVVLAYLMPPVVADGVQGVDDKTFTRRCTEYTQDARGLICNVLRRASTRGVEMPLPTNGPAPASEWPRQQFLPVLAVEGADLKQKYENTASVAGYNATHPCVMCNTLNGPAMLQPLVPLSRLASCDRTPRDIRATEQAIEKALHLATTGASRDEVAAVLHSVWSRGVPQALTNIPGFNPLQSAAVDEMHTLGGMTSRMVTGALGVATGNRGPKQRSELVKHLNQRFLVSRGASGPMTGTRLPPLLPFVLTNDGPCLKSNLTCAELEAMLPHLPHTFLPYTKEAVALAAWAELHNALLNPLPRWEDTRRIYEIYRAFVAAFNASSLPKALVAGLCVPKAHDLLHLLVQMILYGALQNLSLQGAEHAHQPLCKRIFDSTDRRREGVEIAMAKVLRAKEARDLIRDVTTLQFATDPSLAPTPEAATWWKRMAHKPHAAPPIVRGKNRRSDMPRRSGRTLQDICAMTCLTPLVQCGFGNLARLLGDVRVAEGVAGPVTGRERITTYTSVLVAPEGRQAAEKSYAYARPGVSRHLDDDTDCAYNVVRLATRPGQDSASDSYGLLILILSCPLADSGDSRDSSDSDGSDSDGSDRDGDTAQKLRNPPPIYCFLRMLRPLGYTL